MRGRLLHFFVGAVASEAVVVAIRLDDLLADEALKNQTDRRCVEFSRESYIVARIKANE